MMLSKERLSVSLPARPSVMQVTVHPLALPQAPVLPVACGPSIVQLISHVFTHVPSVCFLLLLFIGFIAVMPKDAN